jgi:hypothetical protein
MNPDNAYLSRFGRRVKGQTPLETSLGKVAVHNTVRALGAFNWQGDNVYAFNLPFKRQMGWVSATLFILGLFYALSQIRQGPYLMLLLTLLVGLVPTVVTFSHPQEVPNAGRLIGAVVPACVVAALPLGLLNQFSRERKSIKRSATILTGAIVVLLGIETVESLHNVFSEFEQVQPHHNMPVSATIADLIDGFARQQSGDTYVVFRWDGHRGFDFQAVEILSDVVEPSWSGFIATTQLPDTINAVVGPTLFVLHADDASSLSRLQKAFPDGRIEVLLDPAGEVGLRTFAVDGRP